jgi:hypothetical protein
MAQLRRNDQPNGRVLAKWISQIMDEVNKLVEKRKKLLQMLDSLQSSSARLDGEATGSY